MDSEFEYEPKIAWGVVGRVFLLLFCFLWASMFLSELDISFGRKAAVPWVPVDYLLRFLFYFMALHVVLFWPISQYALPELRKKGSWFRSAVLVLLVSCPLLSYGHYLGTFRNVFDVQELFLVVFPPVVLGTLMYERTEKLWLFSAFVSLSTFLPFFLINDLLGPFETVLYFSPKSDIPSFLRFIAPALAFAALKLNPLTVVQQYGSNASPTQIRTVTL